MGRSGKRLRNRQQKNKEEKPFFSPDSKSAEKAAFFQAKAISVGKPGDKYEKEADSVADSVVNGRDTGNVIQEKEISSIQRESLSTPLEDEKLGTAEQRMEEEKLIQEQPEEEEESLQMQEEEEESLQMQEEEEESLQMQEEEEEPLQMQEEEEEPLQMQEEKEEPLQMQEEEEEMVQAKSDNNGKCAPGPVSETISKESGKGKPLSGKVKKEMERSFGVDFSDVNIHTGEKAEKLNKKLKAQAFTCGKDIFFNDNKFKPEQAAGKKLLAHELTHVVQQKKSKK